MATFDNPDYLLFIIIIICPLATKDTKTIKEVDYTNTLKSRPVNQDECQGKYFNTIETIPLPHLRMNGTPV